MPSVRRRRLSMADASRRRRWWTVRWPFLALLIVVAGAAAAWVAGRGPWFGWDDRPDIVVTMRDASMARVRAGMGPRWLPDRVVLAESLSMAADIELARQDARESVLRDYRLVVRLLKLAAEVADLADAAGGRTEMEMHAAAEAAVDDAAPRIVRAVEVAELVRLTAQGRRRLERARIALEEARDHLAAGRYPEAMALAERSLEHADQAHSAAAQWVRRFADPGQRRAWAQAVDETVTWSRKNPGRGSIVVDKEARLLTLLVGGAPKLRMRAELGMAGVQPKRLAGDDATPEGRYRVVQVKGAGQSRYYKALLLDYPNDDDRRRFEADVRAGRLRRNARPGSGIAIHGHGGKGRDWTHGCVAVTNDEMDELSRWMDVGSPVTIVGSAGAGGSLTDLARPTRRAPAKVAP